MSFNLNDNFIAWHSLSEKVRMKYTLVADFLGSMFPLAGEKSPVSAMIQRRERERERERET